MADKKMVEQITSMEEDFAQWYTDVVLKAELIGYTSVKGCMAIKPAGYAIWELIQKQLDERFKAAGVQNVYMPMFIPESLLEKEKDHVEGFAPEVAWVTYGGLQKLQERLCVRPTSETLFCDFYKNDIQSYRDLPKVYNQWCNVVRWEKETRPFLRSREFLWQEGHTAHATAEEAEERTIQMLNEYADFAEQVLAIPVIKGRKTEKEKFAGAEATYTIEALMHDGKALQSGTSHNFGDGFARAFGIQYTDKENKLQYVHQTSWGLSTRIIGALIMVHGDDSGLVLPPRIAPVQTRVIPIAQHKEGVLEKANELTERLKKAGELLYFKNCEERKKAEELLKKCWPEVSFVVMRLDMQNILEEERIHFGKWDIEFDKKRMIYNGTEIVITDMQWEILQLLMSDSELSFSIREIAYAMNIEVHEAQIYVEELLKTIQEQTGSAIVQKKEERYSFVEITD